MKPKLKSFFDTIYAQCNKNSYIEFRKISNNGRPLVRRKFFRVDDYREIRKHCLLDRTYNCFFGVATRDGRGGEKKNIVEIPALWCDIDFKDINKIKIRKKLKKFKFPPSIIVGSGGGYHLYWILKEPIKRNKITELENLNRRIALALNGDKNACDAARILRVPRTINHKYNPSKKVEILKISKHRYEINDFLILPEVKKIASKNPKQSKKRNWLIPSMKGVGEGERNATGARIAGYFLKKLNKKDLLIIMRTWNYNNKPPLKLNELNDMRFSIKLKFIKRCDRICHTTML